MTRNILIMGATSGIAEAVARRYAEQGARLFLTARNRARLETVSADLSVRGAREVHSFVMDANDYERLPELVDVAWKAFGTIDVALIAYGTLPDQRRADVDLQYALAEFRTNTESVIACLSVLAGRLELEGRGVIAVIGSVAGDRGRASNYFYGAAKAAIDTYASGLRARLFRRGIHVLTIKPGFVSTSMTDNLNLPTWLTATPQAVARDIQRAIDNKKNILYTPWFWRWILLIIRWIPEPIFKRTNL
jgi:decaprenylphospho-beta-D-erythro-pentofuranosid-2-ulose 2-reductase